MFRAKIISTGYYLPSRVLTNKDLEKIVDTSDEWITSRTGIKERRIAADGQASSDLGIEAARMAMDKGGIKPADIDAVICATITPDYFFPSTASQIQKGLGLTNAFAFDLSAACSGYIYGLSVAESLLMQDKVKTVLVIAAEKLSGITDWTDRSTCVLFGDGAGAVILKKVKGESGILSSYLGSDGSLGDLLMLPGGGSRIPASLESVKNKEHFLKMKGNEVFKVAVTRMIESAVKSLEKANLKTEDVRLLIPHQANLRIINAISKRLHLSEEQILVTLHKIGNTSAASIAISLAEAQQKNMIKEGDVIVLVAFGGGFTWGGMVLKW